MNVVDSSAWLEYFAKGANGAHFAQPVQNIDELLVPAICLYEVFKRLYSQTGEDEALQAIGWMSLGKVIDLDQELALSAAILSHEHKLPMADSMILAVARKYQAILWTQDEHFAGLEDVKYIPTA